jgi:hypothetical protein
MRLVWELDIDKKINDGSFRARFQETSTNQLTLNFTFKYEVRKCVKQIIQINVIIFNIFFSNIKSFILKKTIRDKLSPIRCKFNTILPNYESDWELMPIFDNKYNTTKIHEVWIYFTD